MVDAEVLVVGGGPVGLVTALAAARQGLRVRAIDQYQRSALHSYALALHPATLRMLDAHGLGAGVVERGRRVSRIGIYQDAQRVGEIDLSAVGGPFPFVLLLPQIALEGLLEDALGAAGVAVEWNHQALSFDCGDDAVTTLVGRVGKLAPEEWSVHETARVSSASVVGADGHASTVRRMLGARYISVGPSSSYALFEFRSSGAIEPEIRLVFRAGSTDVLWPIDAHRGRFNFEIDAEFDGEPDAGMFHALLAERAPWLQPVPDEVEWGTTVAFDRRLVDRFGEGRVWLAGEAAHLTGPVAVHNMNVGMQEGHDLALRLCAVLRNGNPLADLERYSVDRQSEWLKLLAARERVECSAAAPSWARSLAPRLAECLPASGEDLDALLGQVGLRLA